jgi:hypothetical protein
MHAYDDRARREAAGPILNKIGALLGNRQLRDVLTQSHPMLDFASVIRDRKVVIINLSIETIGLDAAAMLGALLLSRFEVDLMRVNALPIDAASDTRTSVFLYVDEFQYFGQHLYPRLLNLRKYKLACTLAHQLTIQVSPSVLATILGQVSTLIAFRVSPTDAAIIAPSIGQPPELLLDLKPFRAWLRRHHDLSMHLISTLPPRYPERRNYRKVVTSSRERYARASGPLRVATRAPRQGVAAESRRRTRGRP